MKQPRFVQSIALSLALTAGWQTQAAVTLPTSAALPTNSVSNRGFIVRTAQASVTNTVANSLLRAQRQINGLLTNSSGEVIGNVAEPGPQTNGSYFVEYVSFERDAFPVDPIDTNGFATGAFFPSDFFPGIPGSEFETTQFADESIALVVLQPGRYVLGVSANADRTDVNNDDGYAVYVGANPRDFFATKIAEFNRGGAAAFSGNQYVENPVEIIVPVQGAYPFRILHWQQGLGANLNFYLIETNSGSRFLINDPSVAGTPLAYRASSNPAFNTPFIADITPAPGSAGNGSAESLGITLLDGLTSVNTSSVQLTINGATVTPQVVKNGRKTTITFSPGTAWASAQNNVTLVYTDTAGIVRSNSWTFSVNLVGGSSTVVAGQWDFNFGDLRATVGSPLQYLDPSFDGPNGSSGNKTQFGTASSLGVELINGQEAVIMRVPGDLDRRIGYIMTHGILPNGGGTKVNQYTLIMDVLVDTSGSFAASLLNIDTPNNTTDGDLFWQQGNFGQGGGGYNGKGTFTAGSWHRIVAAYDMAANPPVVTKYVDGIKQDDWTANQGLDAARRALLPTAVLFGDGDQDERRTMWVNSIQIRAGKLSDAESYALGGPSALGIPQSIPSSTVRGQWDFDFQDLSSSIGKPLAYFDPSFDGPSGSSENRTAFGTASELGVPLINGVDAEIIAVPGDLDRRIGYIMTHGIAPNGGGTKVNQFTIAMDVLVDTSGSFAASLLNIDTTNNSSDGDLFWQQGNFGQGGGGYNGYGTFTAGAWHRVIAAYDMAATPPVVTKFVDGIKQDDWTANQGLDAARRALLPTAILFGDGDQDERRKMWVNSIQIREGKLSDAEMALLGAPDGNPIPVVLPSSAVAGQWDFNNGDLRATIGRPLAYLDPTFDGPTGSTGNPTVITNAAALNIELISGTDAGVVQVPGDLDRRIGYVMTHGIPANGGGTKVNQYTLIMDILVDTSGSFAASLLNIDTPNNTTDGDLFWQQGNFGQGGGGYNGQGTFTAGTWHRIAAAYNMAANPPVVTKYVDGVFQDDWTANQGLDAARRALLPTAVLFGDGDQDERRTMWVNSIQIRPGALSKRELEALGPPTAGGIPIDIGLEPAPSITIGKVNNLFVLGWPLDVSGYALESAPSITGPWGPVNGVANNSVTVTVGTGNQFFRLRSN